MSSNKSIILHLVLSYLLILNVFSMAAAARDLSIRTSISNPNVFVDGAPCTTWCFDPFLGPVCCVLDSNSKADEGKVNLAAAATDLSIMTSISKPNAARDLSIRTSISNPNVFVDGAVDGAGKAKLVLPLHISLESMNVVRPTRECKTWCLIKIFPPICCEWDSISNSNSNSN